MPAFLRSRPQEHLSSETLLQRAGTLRARPTNVRHTPSHSTTKSNLSGGGKGILSMEVKKCVHICVCILCHSVVYTSLHPRGLEHTRLLCPWNSSGKNTEMGSDFLLQGIFLTQGSKLGLLHCIFFTSEISLEGIEDV